MSSYYGDLIRGSFNKKDKAETKTGENADDEFWAGVKTDAAEDDFWSGDTAAARADLEAEKEEKAHKQREELLALAKALGDFESYKDNNLKGFKDKAGNIIIPTRFYRVEGFSEGLAAVQESRKGK